MSGFKLGYKSGNVFGDEYCNRGMISSICGIIFLDIYSLLLQNV